jgi:hypothetical protein
MGRNTSETICNLITAIILNNNWILNEIQASHLEDSPYPRYLSDNTPFRDGKEFIVDVNINNKGIHDTYIDDLIVLGIDLPNTKN